MKCQYLLMLAATGSLLIGWVGCGADSEFQGNRSLYEQVIRRVQKGDIKTDQEKGIQIPQGTLRAPSSAQLPPDLREASADGEIYVFRPSTNQLLVVFKTWRGKGFNMEGYLYTTEPLLAADISKDYYGHPVVVVEPMELILERQLDRNWYRVSYKLD